MRSITFIAHQSDWSLNERPAARLRMTFATADMDEVDVVPRVVCCVMDSACKETVFISLTSKFCHVMERFLGRNP